MQDYKRQSPLIGKFGDCDQEAQIKDYIEMILQIENNIQHFKSQLPHKPYCTDSLESGLFIRQKEKALEKLYIQANNPAIQHSLLFDIDIENGFYTFEEAGLPVPHFITKSPDSGKVHYGYILKTGICKTQQAKLKPLKYASAVETAMCQALKADHNFVGLITKNPLNPHWSPFWSGAELYDLDFLADNLNLNTKPKIQKPISYGLGRNVNLFDDLRTYAYRNVLNFKNKSNFDKWLAEIERIAIGLNTACNPHNPLPIREITATARSVAKWTWKNFDNATFSAIQSSRGSKNKGKIKSKMQSLLDKALMIDKE